ncbi:exonuclease [Oesophagostomum dentatum]|uniref:Exonuclease n=1 Tax=Oesophagostomum dentatum TaxID=61180 RepID=A0A0B1TS95_OESDE|nr:exonuclease [Oesophagostomum dentatum]
MLRLASVVVRRMSKSTGGQGRLIWIDCEMTGLNYEKQTLVEIAAIVTDKDLKVLQFLEKETAKGECPLAGNSVGMDRCFLNKYMPRLSRHLHYRTVDVSTVKELTRRWFPDEFAGAPQKKCTHRALDDIRESIEELRYYRSAVFREGK